MKKSCNNCYWNVSEDSVVECGNEDTVYKCHFRDYKNWKPKEVKPMEKIVMTEEQAAEIIDSCFEYVVDRESLKKAIYESKKIMLYKMKNQGYIKKSDLEIAEEKYNICRSNYSHSGINFMEFVDFSDSADHLINLQQKELKKLRGES